MPKKPSKPRATPRVVQLNLDVVHGPIMATWNSIAPDLAELGPITNTAAIECCIDANRLTMFADKKAGEHAEAEIQRAINTYGYGRVLRHLARNITLI